jgi:hypothetical protein
MTNWLSAAAVLIGAVLIAGAILFAGRWEMAVGDDAAYRIDRWTGEIIGCPADPNYSGDGPVQMICKAAQSHGGV